jgi:hypothetical protein
MLKNRNISGCCRFLLLILFGFLPLAVFANSALITINYTIGFNGIFSLNTWTPITLSISNNGSQFNGELEILTKSGNEYQKNINISKYRQSLDIASGSQKVFSATILINSYAHPLEIKLFKHGVLIETKSINLRPFYTEKKLFLILANKLPNDIIKNPELNLETKLCHARYLPGSWYGYDGVHYVYLHPNYLKLLTNQQFTAFKKWIRSGGQVIISGSYNQGSLVSSRMSQLIKVNFYGIEKRNESGILSSFADAAILNRHSFLLPNHKIAQSKILLADANIPVIQRKQFGLGDILYVSYDLQEKPFRNWKEKYKFWEKLITFFPAPIELDHFKNKAILSSMMAAIKPHYPSGWTIFIYLLSFILVFTFLIKKINEKQIKLFKGLIGALLIYVSGGLIIYVTFININTFTHNAFTRLLLFGNRQTAIVEHISGFYSLDSNNQMFELKKGPNPVVILPQKRKRRDITFDLNLIEKKESQLIQLDVDKWSYKFYKSKMIIDVPLQASVQYSPDRLTITIENPTQYKINDAYFFFKKKFIKIPDISGRKSTTIELSRKKLSAIEAYIPLESKLVTKSIPVKKTLSSYSRNKFQSEELFLSIYHQYKEINNLIHFFGWVEDDLIKTQLMNESVKFDSVTLLEWDIPTT